MSAQAPNALVVFVAVLASLLEIIDTSIVNVAIPTMMGNLGATLEDISMVVTGYAIANAIVLPLSAWLGARMGRRKYYLGCIALFTITSVACGLAPNLTTLIIFRIFQGLAGGALLPTSQTLIYEQFPKEKAGMAGAIFGMSVMIGPTLGPTLGGYLTDQLGWRSIFNINLPLGILALFVGWAVIRNVEYDANQPKPAQGSIDFFGLFLLTIGIGCLQYMLERGEADDWFDSRTILACAIIAFASLPLFIWWELKAPFPIINLRLFKERIVTIGVLLMGMLGFFLYAVVFILPVFVSSTFHYDATQTGMLFIPGSLLTAFMMPFVGRLMQRFDPRVLIAFGFVVIEIFLVTMAQLSTMSSREEILSALFIRGFAMAFLFVPINSSILSQFKGINLGQVSGMLNLSRQIGGSVGIALGGTLLTKLSAQNYADLLGKVSALNSSAQVTLAQLQGGLSTKMVTNLGQANPYQAALRVLQGKVHLQAFMLSFNQLMYTLAIVVSFAFIPLFFLRFKKGATITAVDSH